jgi:hypothetical protein
LEGKSEEEYLGELEVNEIWRNWYNEELIHVQLFGVLNAL